MDEAERRGRAAGGPAADGFARFLSAQIETGAVDFPKALLVPEDAIVLPVRGLSAVLARLARGARQLVLSPALAYGILVVVWVYQARRTPPPPSAPAPAIVPPAAEAAPRLGPARILDLGSGPTRDRRATARLAPDPADEFVVLSFLIPIRSDPAARYEATIAEAAGRQVVSAAPVHSTDALGNFVLVCRRNLFAPGGYVLTVSEVSRGRAGAGSGDEHRFPFQIRPSEERAAGR